MSTFFKCAILKQKATRYEDSFLNTVTNFTPSINGGENYRMTEHYS